MSSFIREESLHNGFANLPWLVHKFGGTSLANADCYLRVARIVEEQLHSENGSPDTRLAVVVSAIGGKPKTTDLLLDSVKFASERNQDKVDNVLNDVLDKHRSCINGLFLQEGNDHSVIERLEQNLEQDIKDIKDILKTVSLMKWNAKRISELVSGYGELWSGQILTSLLNQRQSKSTAKKNQHFAYLDARRVITVNEDANNDGSIVWGVSEEKLSKVYDEERQLRNNEDFHFVVTGYVAVNTHGVSTTLQRDGSDYSAAIMGRLLKANSISIWTDVDGVLSADPRRVPLAHVLPEVSYNEAMELAYFGAKVIHPKTMQPAIQCEPNIPIYIRNTFHSTFRGSRIYSSKTSQKRDNFVCGFSSIENIAVINVEGSGMIGVPGVSTRLFGTLERAGVNVILISQASSEHSVTFATSSDHAQLAKKALEEEFHREIENCSISDIDLITPCSIIAAVGDGMARTAGCSGRFFSALGDAKINIVAIAQGCSERNISAVVKMDESTRALRAVHAAFRLSHTTVRIAVIGMNELGRSLVTLLENQRSSLRSTFEIDLQVCAILPMKDEGNADIVYLRKDEDGCSDSITMKAYNNATGFTQSDKPHATFVDESVAKLVKEGPDKLLEILFRSECTNHVIFDCTNDETLGQYHAFWLKASVDVVTANNTGLSGPQAQRDEIASAERIYGKESASYLRAVTVGGGLPVIKTLRSLIQTGDKIRRIDGILSVSLSYIMFRISPPPGADISSYYDEDLYNNETLPDSTTEKRKDGSIGCTFTDAVKEAISLGLMEKDTTKDLNNDYTCRVIMVLAKELGMDRGIETADLQLTSEKLLEVIMGTPIDYHNLPADIDIHVKNRVDAVRSRGCVLRHVSSIDVLKRKIDTRIVEVPFHHVFAVTPPSCECFRLFTKRHQQYPLIIQGPSAGVDSTASALLAELLHLMRGKTNPSTASLSRTLSGTSLQSPATN